MKGSLVKIASSPGAHRPRTAARREPVRERLLVAGGRLIAERGGAQVSVADILAAADISRRTFYSYFGNKYELVADLINRALVDGTDMLEALVEQPSEALLPGVVDCYRRLWTLHSDGLTIIASLDPAVMPYIERGHRQFGSALKAVLQRAEDAGLLRNNDAACSFRIISRTAVPLLKIYADHPNGSALYRDAMLALLSEKL